MILAYGPKVMEHFTRPRNVGEMKDADGVGKFSNDVDGDIVVISIKVKDEIITNIKFQVFGCAAAIASSSVFTEMVKGKRIEEALKVTKESISEALDSLPSEKVECSVLAPDALREAVSDYRSRQGRGFNTTYEVPHPKS
jgi:nitrogen fixation NifU-like protein